MGLASLLCGGCIVVPEPHGGGGGPAPTPTDVAVSLGDQRMLGYHVVAGSDSEIPSGDIGYVITANGQGGYRVSFTDTQGSAAVFSGTITCDTTFDPTKLGGLTGNENITLSTDDSTITFQDAPGSTLDGVDLVSGTDPIYVDLTVDGHHSGFGVYFTGATSGLLLDSTYDPVAFTSP